MGPSTTSTTTTTQEITATMAWGTAQPRRMHEGDRINILWALVGILVVALVISMAINCRFYRRSRRSTNEGASRVEMRPLLEAQEMADRQSGILNLAYEGGPESFV